MFQLVRFTLNCIKMWKWSKYDFHNNNLMVHSLLCLKRLQSHWRWPFILWNRTNNLQTYCVVISFVYVLLNHINKASASLMLFLWHVIGVIESRRWKKIYKKILCCVCNKWHQLTLLWILRKKHQWISHWCLSTFFCFCSHPIPSIPEQ